MDGVWRTERNQVTRDFVFIFFTSLLIENRFFSQSPLHTSIILNEFPLLLMSRFYFKLWCNTAYGTSFLSLLNSDKIHMERFCVLIGLALQTNTWFGTIPTFPPVVSSISRSLFDLYSVRIAHSWPSPRIFFISSPRNTSVWLLALHSRWRAETLCRTCYIKKKTGVIQTTTIHNICNYRE